MAGKDAMEVKVDDRGLRELAAAIREEANGKQLRKDLIKSLRTAVEPGVRAVQGRLRSMPHHSHLASAPTPGLGTYLAGRTRAQVKLTGRSAGVAVRIPQTPQLRGFKFAARRLDRGHWRHQVFGKGIWVSQVSPIPNYMDTTLTRDKAKYRAAVVAAMDDMRDRLGRRKYGSK